MRREFGYSQRTDLAFFIVAAAFVLAAVYLAFLGHFFSAALLVVVAGLVTYVIRLLRRRNAPFLVLDQSGLACPARRLRLDWAEIERAYLLYPPKRVGGRPSLALELRRDLGADSAHRPRFVKRDAPLPALCIDLPALDAPVEDVMRHIERCAPGRVTPAERYEPPEFE